MNKLSNYKIQLIKEGLLDYLIYTVNGKMGFFASKEEVLRELPKIPNYYHPKVFSVKKKPTSDTLCMVVDHRDGGFSSMQTVGELLQGRTWELPYRLYSQIAV